MSKNKQIAEAVRGGMEIFVPEDRANKAKGGAKKHASYSSVKSRQKGNTQKLGDLEKFSEVIEKLTEQIASQASPLNIKVK